ncbi:hypothetical protein HFP15_37885 [Amycolatopsis sp. K13G38]|uniref:Uncharacterized protein n=1 Tax=Amycolatopsis acididurans TaxID=2724524 RepID=A0ABX1JJJ2_9PSEU|nr:hypothetical protein [Amycolatopsis acididurans]NKQ58630.1 hypothetical protein [Amycolatopsis acididurans]
MQTGAGGGTGEKGPATLGGRRGEVVGERFAGGTGGIRRFDRQIPAGQVDGDTRGTQHLLADRTDMPQCHRLARPVMTTHHPVFVATFRWSTSNAITVPSRRSGQGPPSERGRVAPATFAPGQR